MYIGAYFSVVDVGEIEKHSNRCKDLLVALASAVLAVRDIDDDRLELVLAHQIAVNASMRPVVVVSIVRSLVVQNVVCGRVTLVAD